MHIFDSHIPVISTPSVFPQKSAILLIFKELNNFKFGYKYIKANTNIYDKNKHHQINSRIYFHNILYFL